MRKTVLFLMTIISILSFQVTHAQIDVGIRACTPDDTSEMLKVFSDENLFQKLVAVETLTTTKTAATSVIVHEIDTVQRQWWGEIVPQLPSCATVMNITLLFGRFLDESLISYLSFSQLDPEMSQYHVDQIARINDEISGLTKQINDSK